MFVSGCGQTGDSSGTEVADDVEFGKDDYQNITFSGNALGMAMLPELNRTASTMHSYPPRAFTWH